MAADPSLTPGRVGLRELVERLDAQSRARDTYPQVPGLAALRAEADTLHARVDDGRDDGKAMEWTWRRDCVAPPRE